jgi:S1-C subfamily serine protease
MFFYGINDMFGGDIILVIEDKPINSKEELKHYISHHHVQGTKTKFKVLRNGKPIDIEPDY